MAEPVQVCVTLALPPELPRAQAAQVRVLLRELVQAAVERELAQMRARLAERPEPVRAPALELVELH